MTLITDQHSVGARVRSAMADAGDSSIMDATEIVELTEEAVLELLIGREVHRGDDESLARRRKKRWPFPGTVEIWLPQPDGNDRYLLLTCLNLSLHGIGILSEEALPIGAELALAIHQPEVSLHGRGVVRHSTLTDNGYYCGIQFRYQD